MDYARRQRLLRESLASVHADALFVTLLPNIRYLCGFTGSTGVLVVTADEAVFFTDGRYTEQAHEEIKRARVAIAQGPALAAAVKWLNTRRLRSVGIEADHLTVAARNTLKRALPSSCKLRELTGTVEALRLIKDAGELRLIRASVDLATSLLDVAMKAIRPGITETEVAAEMEYAARCRGTEGMSFDTIVASGTRSALPHVRASTALIPPRGFVVLDWGVILSGYCSDMTRTVGVGKVSRSDRDLYEAVREAQQAAVEAVRPGVTCGEVDHAARSVLRKARLDRYFTHSTGHGVGLEVHEPPRIGRGQQETLRSGMVITIEPGVYVPGRGGVRIEDMVFVREGGCDVLTPAPKTWIEL